MLEELIQLEPSRLDENTQKLFYTIMKVIDERDKLEQKNTELRIQVSSRETVADELQQKIDKAIEELEKGITFCINDSQGIYDRCNIAINREKKVLEILKGEPNNENNK